VPRLLQLRDLERGELELLLVLALPGLAIGRVGCDVLRAFWPMVAVGREVVDVPRTSVPLFGSGDAISASSASRLRLKFSYARRADLFNESGFLASRHA
jgi:hypothetical protein